MICRQSSSRNRRDRIGDPDAARARRSAGQGQVLSNRLNGVMRRGDGVLVRGRTLHIGMGEGQTRLRLDTVAEGSRYRGPGL